MRWIKGRRGLAGLMLWVGTVAGGQQALPAPNVNLVFLDPAHGGADPGAQLGEKLVEKDVNLALEVKLRAALAAKSFAVVSSRDGDAGPASDQRAEMANHARPVACILIHATSSGSGAYLAASSVTPDAAPQAVLPWSTAQGAYVAESQNLMDGIAGALTAASVKPTKLRASVPPIDSLICPAVLVEVAPLSGKGADDGDYQQKIVDALTQALLAWRTRAIAARDAAKNAPPVSLNRPVVVTKNSVGAGE